MQLYELLLDVMEEDVCNLCGWGKIRQQELRKVQLECSPKKILAFSISKFIEKLKQVPSEEIGTGDKLCRELNGYHEPLEFKETLNGKIRMIRSKAIIILVMAYDVFTSEKGK
jgi:hypothetical protein